MTNHTLQRSIYKTGTSLAGVTVILGAFGAHALKEVISPEMLQVFETGIKYQFIHSIAIILIAAMLRYIDERIARIAFTLFIVGITFFCGSIYLLSTRQILLGNAIQWIGFITPLGGLSLIGGWFVLAVKGYQIPDGIKRSHRKKNNSTSEE